MKIITILTLVIIVSCGGPGGGPDDNAAPEIDRTLPTILSDKPSGFYKENPLVTLTPSDDKAGVKALYCISDSICCGEPGGPELALLEYSTPLIVGAVEGNFCIVFRAEDSSGNKSPLQKREYEINTTPPDLSESNVAKVHFQTRELLANHSYKLTSNDFGKSDHYFSLLNIGNDPSSVEAAQDGCDQVATDGETFDLEALGIPFAFNETTFQRGPEELTQLLEGDDNISIPLSLSSLNYGTNKLVSVLSRVANQDNIFSTCDFVSITVKDFTIFNIGNPTFGGVSSFEGNISPFGFFKDSLAPTATTGSAANADSSTGVVLEQGFLKIIN
jgi:hypothetical protein